MMMKVVGDLKGFEGDFDECCGVKFCFVLHCGRLWKAMCYQMASVTNSLQLVFEVLFFCLPWPLRDRSWCTADFGVHM